LRLRASPAASEKGKPVVRQVITTSRTSRASRIPKLKQQNLNNLHSFQNPDEALA
jgi:hypothetical protein